MGRRSSLALCLPLALTLWLTAGCGESDPQTELVLVVDTTLDTPFEADMVIVTVEGPSGSTERYEAPLAGPAAVPFPLTLGLSPGGSRLEPVTITARATVLDIDVVERQVRTAFVSGERKLVRLLLLGECVSVTCGTGETCVEGATCQSIDVPGSRLPDFTGVPPSPDPRDLCAAGRALAPTTIGCNGPILGPFVPDRTFGGRCHPNDTDPPPCVEGGICSSIDGVDGICLLTCDLSEFYVSTSGCPVGSRCFDLPSGPLCYPDCYEGRDCTSDSCDREGSCLPPAPVDAGPTGDAGPTDAGVPPADAS